jgi:hypothetical protein
VNRLGFKRLKMTEDIVHRASVSYSPAPLRARKERQKIHRQGGVRQFIGGQVWSCPCQGGTGIR